MITILNGGIHSVIQDLGRIGFQQYGVIVGGVMDRYALRIANLLVGNEEHEAGIEITFGKTSLLFHDDRIIAITGGQLQPHLNGELLKNNQPVSVQKDDILQFKTPTTGCRAYISISGGFTIEKVLGSKSTCEKAKFGGWQGRVLKKGDTIQLGKLATTHKNLMSNQLNNWHINCQYLYSFKTEVIPIHVVPGIDFTLFKQSSIERFEGLTYIVSSRSNRMGYHLENESKIQLAQQQEILSEAVTYGTIQVPPSGKPMILMADAQTVGGYPKIAQVLESDFSRLAQVLPGQKIQFKFVTLETAQEKLFQYESYMQQIKYSIQQRTQ